MNTLRIAGLKWVDETTKHLLKDLQSVLYAGIVDEPKGDKDEDLSEQLETEVFSTSHITFDDDYHGFIYVKFCDEWVSFQYFA